MPALSRAALLTCLLGGVAFAAEPEPGDAPTQEEVPVEEATAEEGPVDADPVPVDPVPDEDELSAYRWGGVVVPLIGYNTTDGFGTGLGGEIFDRPRDDAFGYRNKIRISTYWAVSGRYSSHLLQYDRRTRHEYFVRLIYRFWSDMIYVGSGGQDVVTLRDPSLSLGNKVQGPSIALGGTFRLGASPARVFAQIYGRYALVNAAAGGILATEAPLGVEGGAYVDASLGVAMEEVDRWPLPIKGIKAEASVRGGFTASGGTLAPIVGVNIELTGWYPLAGERLVIGARALFDKTWGDRPFFEQEWLGGQARDEVAYEQMLLGYGRTRTRGDGFIANMIELRAFVIQSRHPFWDVGLYASVFAESAFIFEKNSPGPHLPTIGIGPVVLWQGAVNLRPWAGWGWVREAEGEKRKAKAQFGLALSGPL